MSEETVERESTHLLGQQQHRGAKHIWNLFENPIFVMCCRIRLRSRQAVGWGVISLTIAAFIFFVVYLTATSRGVSPAIAAKGAVIPLLVLQGIILMLLGTGGVASGMALERDQGTLNFQRMTPMSPASKILGYLFGLPSRQYMMFLVTMPFLIAAVVIGGISILTVLHFYLIFFTTVWLYHMIGMVSGMISPRTRRVGMFAMVAILILYWIMPQLSTIGFTFFGFVTVIPTFKMLLLSELTTNPAAVQKLMRSGILSDWQELQFFHFHIHPTVYTLVIQGVLLLTCFIVVYRKWHREENHALPKSYALGLFAWVQFFLIGSLWPFLTQTKKLMGILHKLGQMSPAFYGDIILFALFALSGVLGLWLIYIITPNWFTYANGLRRAQKHHKTNVPLWSDASSGVWFALLFSFMTAVSYTVLLRLMLLQGKAFVSLPPLFKMVMLPLFFTLALLGLQAFRERLEKKGFLFLLFFLWIVPFFVSVILMASFKEYVASVYIMTTNPIAALVYELQYLNLGVLGISKSGIKYLKHIPRLAFVSLFVHGTIAALGLWFLREKTHLVRQSEERRTNKNTAEKKSFSTTESNKTKQIQA